MAGVKHETWIRGGPTLLPTRVEVGCDGCSWRGTARSGAAAHKLALNHERDVLARETGGRTSDQEEAENLVIGLVILAGLALLVWVLFAVGWVAEFLVVCLVVAVVAVVLKVALL